MSFSSLSTSSSPPFGSLSPCSTCSFVEDRRHSLASLSSLSSLSDISPLPSPQAKATDSADAGTGTPQVPLNALGLSNGSLSPSLNDAGSESMEENEGSDGLQQQLVYPYAPSAWDASITSESENDSSHNSSCAITRDPHPLVHTRCLPLPRLKPLDLSSSTPSVHVNEEEEAAQYPFIDPLETGMRSLPTELISQIFEDTLAHPSGSLRLSLLLTSKATYRRVIPTLYRDVILTKDNVQRYFYGLGADVGETPSSLSTGYEPPEIWPVSGPGLAPLHTMGLSYEPSAEKVTPFIRKFTLCNLVESLTVSDLPSFLYLLRAASRTYVDGMDTWTHRVLFDQIDKITIGEEVFSELDNNLLGMRGLLGEIWNVIKGDAVHLHFPSHKKLKRETYMTAVNAFGAPSSIGQRDRLLGELVIRTPTLDGVGLDQTAASLVRIYLEPMVISSGTMTTARCEECEAALANGNGAAGTDGVGTELGQEGEVSEDQGIQVKEFIRRQFWPSVPAPAPTPAQPPVHTPASPTALVQAQSVALTHSP
ncbi:hypothetical protein I317_06944 [Kwoniella heveanensis CBS 569]|nr:hypothetical protein I317_06944 [Kwoniella heveanensis CBS 569]